MKKSFALASAALLSLMITACVTVTVPVAATGNPIGSKTGTSSGTIVLWLFGAANAGALDAAKSAGITRISTVDTKTESFLGGLVVTITTTVTGE